MTWTCRSCAPAIGPAAAGQGLCPAHTTGLLAELADQRAAAAADLARCSAERLALQLQLNEANTALADRQGRAWEHRARA